MTAPNSIDRLAERVRWWVYRIAAANVAGAVALGWLAPEMRTPLFVWIGATAFAALWVGILNLGTSPALRSVEESGFKRNRDHFLYHSLRPSHPPRAYALGCGFLLLAALAAARGSLAAGALVMATYFLVGWSGFAWALDPIDRPPETPRASVVETGPDPWVEAWKDVGEDESPREAASDGPTPLPPPASGRGDI